MILVKFDILKLSLKLWLLITKNKIFIYTRIVQLFFSRKLFIYYKKSWPTGIFQCIIKSKRKTKGKKNGNEVSIYLTHGKLGKNIRPGIRSNRVWSFFCWLGLKVEKKNVFFFINKVYIIHKTQYYSMNFQFF